MVDARLCTGGSSGLQSGFKTYPVVSSNPALGPAGGLCVDRVGRFGLTDVVKTMFLLLDPLTWPLLPTAFIVVIALSTWKAWSSVVEGYEGSYLPNCQSNLAIALGAL